MSSREFLLTTIILAISVQLTRFLPFVFFGENRKIPRIITYLGNVLPAAMMGLLVIYCYKDYDISSMLPALLSGVATAAIHIYKKNTILSIALGTAIYMVLIRIL